MFPEATPTLNISESEAKVAEDNPAASVDEEEVPRVATPPSHQDVVLEENVTDPPASDVEVENPEAATTKTTEANDVVMAEAHVVPEANVVPETTVVPEVQASEATEAPAVNATPKVNATTPYVQAPEAHVAPEAHEDNANAPVPLQDLT